MFKISTKSILSKARTGRLETAHGTIETPNFMPVGTQGTVKALTPKQVAEIGAQIILSNTYHLYLRPGLEVIEKAGGLHKMMDWHGPILTDSGGFQVFSLAQLRKITDEGVMFSSHIDGSEQFFTPEKVVEAQIVFGSDIMMPLDECTEYPADKAIVEEALRRTTRWAKRSREAFLTPSRLSSGHPSPQSGEGNKSPACGGGERGEVLFGIVQGGMYKDLRKRSAEEIRALDFPGYGIGGLSVGEPKELMLEMLEVSTENLEYEKPKHLMGVGFPEDIEEAVKYGIDLFDCVIPTRLARHGAFITKEGKSIIRNAKFEKDLSPLDKTCDCYACEHFSRAYIRHLFIAKEILAMTLMTIHNLRYFMRLMADIRSKIAKNEV